MVAVAAFTWAAKLIATEAMVVDPLTAIEYVWPSNSSTTDDRPVRLTPLRSITEALAEANSLTVCTDTAGTVVPESVNTPLDALSVMPLMFSAVAMDKAKALVLAGPVTSTGV